MKIYLSAIETAAEHALAATEAKVPNVLTSFFYAAWRGGMGSVKGVALSRCLRFAKGRLADSGAHTFRVAGWGAASAASDALSTDFDEFLVAYIVWLLKMRRSGLLDHWVELDIGLVAGTRWVREQRRKLIGAGLGHGLIQVWHSDEHDWSDWLHLLDEARTPGRSGYVAIEGHNDGIRAQHDYTKFLKPAFERGVRVHAFKVTDTKGLLRWPFYSVDSTSWLSPERYGLQTVTDRLGVARTDRAPASKQRRSWRAGISKRPNVRERLALLTASAAAWAECERAVDATWRRRGVDWEAQLSKEACAA